MPATPSAIMPANLFSGMSMNLFTGMPADLFSGFLSNMFAGMPMDLFPTMLGNLFPELPVKLFASIPANPFPGLPVNLFIAMPINRLAGIPISLISGNPQNRKTAYPSNRKGGFQMVVGMKTIAIVSKKGGGGKTTIATEVGTIAVRNGYRVIIFDCDPQASAGLWSDDRGGREPKVIAVQAPRIEKMQAQALADKYNFILIDTPGNATDVGLKAARVADLVLVPAKASPRDAHAIRATVEAVNELVGKGSFVVLNEIKTRTTLGGMMLKTLNDLGIRVCPVQLGNRVAYVTATVDGRTATEFDPTSIAAQEVEALWSWICRQLRVPESREDLDQVLRKAGRQAQRQTRKPASRNSE